MDKLVFIVYALSFLCRLKHILDAKIKSHLRNQVNCYAAKTLHFLISILKISKVCFSFEFYIKNIQQMTKSMSWLVNKL